MRKISVPNMECIVLFVLQSTEFWQDFRHYRSNNKSRVFGWFFFCYSCSISDSFLHIWSSFERMKAKNIQRSHLHRLIFLFCVSHVVPCVVTSVNLYLAFLVFRGQGLCMWLCLVYINLIYKRQNKSKFLISLVNMQQYISCTYFKLFSIWKLL